MDIVEQYFFDVKKEIENKTFCAIYGAGVVAEAVYKALNEHGIRVNCFCVSDKAQNKEEVFGIPVIQIDELDLNKEKTLMLVAVKPPFVQEVNQFLFQNGWKDYLIAPVEVLKRYGKQLDNYTRPILEITAKIGCSVHCRYCPQDLLYQRYFADRNRISKMSLEDYKQYIDKTPTNTIVAFAGFVEPFLHEAASEMMLYANSTGRDVSLYTTLVGMTKDDFYKIKDIPFYEVVLHLPDQNGYANIPVTEEYLELLDLMVEAKKPNGDSFILYANCQGEPDKAVMSRIEGKVRVISDLVDRAGNLQDDGLRSQSKIKDSIICDRSKDLNHNILLPDGTVVLCCMDFGLEHILGNLKSESYDEIQQGKERHKVIKLMSYKWKRGGGYFTLQEVHKCKSHIRKVEL